MKKNKRDTETKNNSANVIGGRGQSAVLGQRYLNDKRHSWPINTSQEAAIFEFQRDFAAGKIPLESYPCECGTPAEELLVLSYKERYGLNAPMKICPKCGLVMQNPRLTQESYNEFYNTYYNKIAGSQAESEFALQMQQGKEIIAFIRQFARLKSHAEILEVGCGAGGILASFKQQGFVCKGIDVGGEYVEHSHKEHGLDLEKCTMQELAARGGKYDVIILNHVVEHLVDMPRELAALRTLLKDDGVVYMACPGIKAVAQGQSYDGNYLLYFWLPHVRYFSLGTLAQVMRWNGFALIAGNEMIQSLYKKSDTENREIQNFSTDILAYMTMTEAAYLNRWHGQEEQLIQNIRQQNNIIQTLTGWLEHQRIGQAKLRQNLLTYRGKKVAVYGMNVLGIQAIIEAHQVGADIAYYVSPAQLNLPFTWHKPGDKLPPTDLLLVADTTDPVAVADGLDITEGTKVLPLYRMLW